MKATFIVDRKRLHFGMDSHKMLKTFSNSAILGIGWRGGTCPCVQAENEKKELLLHKFAESADEVQRVC